MQDSTGWKAVVGPIVGLAALLFAINAGAAQYQQGVTDLRAQSRATATASASVRLADLATPTAVATPTPAPPTAVSGADSAGDTSSEPDGSSDGVDDGGDAPVDSAVTEGEAEGPDSAGIDTEADAETDAATDTVVAVAASAEVLAILDKAGCAACHVIPSVPGAAGVIGPDLSTIGSEGAQRVPGQTAAAYIEESIREPNAVIALQCPLGPCLANIMPQDFSERLEDSQIEALVEFLALLTAGS